MRQKNTHNGTAMEEFHPSPAKQTLRYAKVRAKRNKDFRMRYLSR